MEKLLICCPTNRKWAITPMIAGPSLLTLYIYFQHLPTRSTTYLLTELTAKQGHCPPSKAHKSTLPFCSSLPNVRGMFGHRLESRASWSKLKLKDSPLRPKNAFNLPTVLLRSIKQVQCSRLGSPHLRRRSHLAWLSSGARNCRSLPEPKLDLHSPAECGRDCHHPKP